MTNDDTPEVLNDVDLDAAAGAGKTAKKDDFPDVCKTPPPASMFESSADLLLGTATRNSFDVVTGKNTKG